eukprot:jgi/Psemu1/14605/gm1.14605_g
MPLDQVDASYFSDPEIWLKNSGGANAREGFRIEIGRTNRPSDGNAALYPADDGVYADYIIFRPRDP